MKPIWIIETIDPSSETGTHYRFHSLCSGSHYDARCAMIKINPDVTVSGHDGLLHGMKGSTWAIRATRSKFNGAPNL
jgi:hypothetical protein